MAVSVVDANSTRPDEKIPPLHRDMPPLPRLKGKTMIEKILTNVKWHELKKVIPDDQNIIDQMIVRTINELVDAVNTILSRTYTVPIEDIANVPQENKFDPYAEQRNYDAYVKNRHLIGKLCKFKCGQGCYYGILTNIKRKPHEVPFESNGRAFRTCEPVKSTDSIIYKGDNNEK